MMEPVDTFEHAGLLVRIRWEEFDQQHANPRDCSNLGVMFCDYRGYTLGDEDAPDPRDQTITCDRCDGEGETRDKEYGNRIECPRCEGEGELHPGIVGYLQREHGARVVLPLFVYEHSGITMSAGGRLDSGEDDMRSTGRFVGDAAGWDTSTVGVIFDTEETRKEIWGDEELTDERIAELLKEEVTYYAAYLEGSVFGYEVVQAERDEDGDLVDSASAEVLDSCWGFLELNVHDDDASVRQEAKSSAEVCARQIAEERDEAFRWACRDVVTV